MSFKAILTVSDAEEAARQIRGEAETRAKERIAEAEAAGEETIRAAGEKPPRS